MKNAKVWVGAAALALVLAGCDKRDVLPGGACSFEGDKNTNSNGFSYTCAKVPETGRLIWQQDTALKPDRP